MNTEKPMYRWQEIPWQKLERKVFKLQKQIYRAANRGDVKTVRRLQKLLLNSWSAKCLALRKVTQDNQGKKTAGVDGVKSLPPAARLKLIGQLKLSHRATPTRHNRALQTLVKLALEPEWEALFEPNSYGFRPGRSAHDAVEAISIAIRKKPKYILDAGIAKCFDRISHDKLLEKINPNPTLRRQLRAWLKAGVMEGKELFPTEEGTAQGDVISPLLANIALHGLETMLMEFIANPPEELKKEIIGDSQTRRKQTLTVVRYADDFVVIHENIEVIEKCQEIAGTWLKDMGLALKPSKTRIAHTREKHDGEEPGINFLGFNIRHHNTSKYKSGKTMKGYVTHTKPEKGKITAHYQKIAQIIDCLKSAPQERVINTLNPIIREWANYFRTGVSSEIFQKLDHLIFQKLWAWAKKRHPNKGAKWVKDKYWQRIGDNNWVFALKENEGYLILNKHANTHIKRHIKTKGNASPYDRNLIYWSTRRGSYPRHCHDQKTTFIGKSKIGRGMHDKHQSIEERYEGKLSRTVLKTSRKGNFLA